MPVLHDLASLKIEWFAPVFCGSLIFFRILVMLLLNPVLGGQAIPGQVKLVTALVLTFYLYPLLVPPLLNTFPKDSLFLTALFVKEIFFGLTIGLVTSMTFYALQSAGSIVDDQRGGANAQAINPQIGQVTLFGNMFFWLSVTFFIATGGHLLFLQAFCLSFKTIPILELPHLAAGFSPFLQFVVHLAANVIVIAVQLSAPVLIAILLTDIVLGIANKMAPQINVFELGFAVKGYVAPLMLYISLLVLVTQMNVIMDLMVKSIYQLSALFSG